MKKFLFIVGAAVMFSSCGARVSSPLRGAFYTDVKSPLIATGNASSSKVGKASASSILGFVAIGDAGIDAAMKSSGITKIHHVDQEAKSILGIIAKYTVVVYGE